MRSTQDWSRLGGLFIAALAGAVALAVLGPRLLGFAGGPEVEIITALKRTEKDGLTLPIPGAGAPLTSRTHHFSRITVAVAPGGQSAEAYATLDFQGALGATTISTAGVERVPFVLRNGDWVPATSQAPRLVAVVTALETRRRAMEAGRAGDLARLVSPAGDGGTPGVVEGSGREWDDLLAVRHRRYGVESWYARLERDEAVVTEHYRLEGELPDRPVDSRGARELSLVRVGDEFLFSLRLM
ncbi:hypothetical protein DRW03_26315 [Corallococcus sp. H22C18031201]|nr:hypothetical protein DRW03_26315 [Corallococcus sp. H22C18031201]